MTSAPLVERTFEVAVPLDEAWALLSDVEAWPDWAPHIRSVRLVGDHLGPDAAGEFKFRPAGTARFAITEWTPGSQWTWHGRALGLPIDYVHRFRAVDDTHTELTWTVELTGVNPGLRSRLFARMYTRNIDQAWPRFVSMAQTSKT